MAEHRLFVGGGSDESMRAIAIALLAGAAAAGCAVTTADGRRLALGSDAFRGYAESVFRRQNAVLNEIAFALEEPELDEGRRGALEAGESRLLDACAELNATAAARRDASRRGVLDRLRTARTAPECERAADAAAALVEQPAG
jgi:hypothetical protein